MANLGAFAGGLASGIRSGQEFALQRERAATDKDMRERGMAITEQDAAGRQDERDRVSSYRDSMKALTDQAYGEQDVQDGTTTKRVKFSPGEDSGRDAKFFIDATALQLKHGAASPKDLEAAADYARKMQGTESGKAFMGVLAGDPASMKVVAAKLGFDPATAKLVVDKSKNIFRLDTSKGPVDLLEQSRYLGAMEAHNAMTGATADARSGVKFEADVGKINSQADYFTSKGNLADANATVVPSKIAKNNAEAGKASKQGEASMMRARSAGQGVTDKKLASEIMAASKGMAGPDPTGDGKAPYTEKYAYLSGKANELAQSGKAKGGLGAVTAARQEWNDTEAKIASQLSSIDKKVLKDKYKTSDVSTLTARAMKAWAAKNTLAAPVSGSSDQADSEE